MQINRAEIIDIYSKALRAEKNALKELDPRERSALDEIINALAKKQMSVKVNKISLSELSNKLTKKGCTRDKSFILVRLFYGILNFLGLRISSESLYNKIHSKELASSLNEPPSRPRSEELAPILKERPSQFRSRFPDFSILSESDAVVELETLSGLHSPKASFEKEYQGNTPLAKRQRALGEKLEANFYLTRARGGGDCFYLSYLCGLLYLATDDVEAIRVLNNLMNIPFPMNSLIHHIETMRASSLEEKRTYVRDLLTKTDEVEQLALSLRKGAVAMMDRSLNEDTILLYCHTSGNSELVSITTKEEYVKKVGTAKENAQELEIRMLNDHLSPFALCYAGGVSAHDGFTTNNQQGKICLLQRRNHFDLLIPHTQAHIRPLA